MHASEENARAVYDRRLGARRAELSALGRTDARLALVRLVIFLAGAGLIWPVLMTRTLSWAWMVLPVVAFIAVAWIHDGVIRRRTAMRRAVGFYEAGLARLEERWAGNGRSGDEFLDNGHPYADDLDLFGRGSLFELMCTARTRAGERTLARWLLAPAEPEEVRRRQEAVRELQGALDLREELARLGEDVRADDDPDGLTDWAAAPVLLAARWPVGVAAALAVANGIVIGTWLLGDVTGWLAVVPVAVGALFALSFQPRVSRVLREAGGPEHELELLAGLLARLERQSFEAPLLRELCKSLDADGSPPSRRIARLVRLIELRDSRRNMIFAPIAALLLLGTQLAFAIERWRAVSGVHVSEWLAVVGQFEALSALASMAYERPQDVFPEIVDEGPVLEGQALGHPLLPEATCVRNDVAFAEPLRLLLVSGSNMSGKSTLLRTLGVSIVLAQAGAPVRARRLRLSPLAVGASMNVRDSLQSGTSHFYAEITRLREILDLGDGRRRLFFLLDEVLHGTNSHDRRIGAEALVGELLERGGLGLVTTHDLALSEVAEGLGPRAVNVHFEDRVEEGRMVFDYRLKPGVVQKSNALELMRRVGLNV
jgi:hypothetical protein